MSRSLYYEPPRLPSNCTPGQLNYFGREVFSPCTSVDPSFAGPVQMWRPQFDDSVIPDLMDPWNPWMQGLRPAAFPPPPNNFFN